MRPGSYGGLRSLEVRHQHRHRHARDAARMRHELGGVRELRQDSRGHEAAHLDLGEAGCGLRIDPGLLGLERHDAVDALQAVARTDLADQDIHGVGSR